MNSMERQKGESGSRRAALALAVALFSTLPGCRRQSPPEGQTPPEWTKLHAELKVEVARTQDESERGLKFRQNLPRNEGVYFIFEKEQRLPFYMRDTRIPLSIAFIRDDGIIESIADMIPLDERSVVSVGPARFALEVNRGWFEENGIRPGDKVVLKEGQISFFRRSGSGIRNE